ncbi:MAG: hypothetical protein Q8N63_07990 [Nanoarchaeota archaeon]|nr:hypothetical protein [Nanoarchaeota archaeon]
MAENQPNRYQEFEQKYAYFSQVNQGLEGAAKSTAIPYNIRHLTEAIVAQEMPEDTPEKARNKQIILKDIHETKSQEKIVTTLRYWAGSIKEDTNNFAESDLEGILNSAPEGYVDFALSLVKPKESYSGSNSGVYAEIAGLQKEMEEMKNIDPKKIEEIVTKKLKSEYDENNEKDKKALGLIGALRAIDQEITILKYQDLFLEKQSKYSAKLEGKKAGYLAANLQGADFVNFYGDSLQAMEDARKQAQKQAEIDAKKQKRNHNTAA